MIALFRSLFKLGYLNVHTCFKDAIETSEINNHLETVTTKDAEIDRLNYKIELQGWEIEV